MTLGRKRSRANVWILGDRVDGESQEEFLSIAASPWLLMKAAHQVMRKRLRGKGRMRLRSSKEEQQNRISLPSSLSFPLDSHWLIAGA